MARGGATEAERRPPYHALPADEALAEVGGDPRGLDAGEAQRRLERFGSNRIREVPPPSALTILLRQFASPIIWILLAAAAVTAFLEEFTDAAVIAAVLILNAVIGFIQERKAEQSVRALMSVVAPQAHVLREGHERSVSSTTIVPGDIVILESGSRVPADVRLMHTIGLEVDESLLTGESTPVTKHEEPVAANASLGDRSSMCFAGSVVTSGRGRGVVVGTGEQTELGAIAGFMREAHQPQTPLQRRVQLFSRIITVVVIGGAALAFAIGTVRGEPASEMFRVAVALAVAAVPEGLPVAYTITLALGVRRMARRNAIVRQLTAVETLGSTTVIGSDKTGTLTQNRMVVQEIRTAGGDVFRPGDGAPPESVGAILQAAVLSSEAELAGVDEDEAHTGDPTELALLLVARDLGLEPADLREEYPEFARVPFESARQYAASVRERDGRHVVFVKGAPEKVLEMCNRVGGAEGTERMREAVVKQSHEMAARALRVLGFAEVELEEPLPSPTAVGRPGNLTFLGLVGMMDPPAPGVREAIAGCRSAGLRVIMITGDHALTARAIGEDLGLEAESVLVGSDIEQLDDDALADALAATSIFARVSPEQKLRLTRVLRARGHVVAVTGDGVNDAPALRAADIGVAMGGRGTDVAREAADIVLTDDNFVSIYAAVEEGRVTFDNIRKVTFFLVSTGVASVITLLAALSLGWAIPFIAVQLLWLNLVTNGLQDVALAFEPGEPDVLDRPPRPVNEGVLSRIMWERVVVVGIVMAVGTLAMFRWETEVEDRSLELAQTVALTTMVLFQTAHVGNSRSEMRSVFRLNPLSNPFLFIATAAAAGVHVAALYLPPTQYLLGFEPIPLDSWVRMGAVAFTVIAASELHKLLRGQAALLHRHPLPA